MNKIGILGGTFDPIHYGHLFIAQNAKHCFNLDKVMFIPTGISPHKPLVKVTDKKHRFGMTKMALKGNDGFEISDIEYLKDDVSYTVDTVAALKGVYPGAALYYIIGADSLYDITGWKSFRKLAKMIEIITINRMTGKYIDIAEIAKTISDKYKTQIHTLEVPIIEISSTEIRNRVREGLPIKYMLPESVERYINNNKLYR